MLRYSYPVLDYEFCLRRLLISEMNLRRMIMRDLNAITKGLIIINVTTIEEDVSIRNGKDSNCVEIILRRIRHLLSNDRLVNVIARVLRSVPLISTRIRSDQAIFLSSLRYLHL